MAQLACILVIVFVAIGIRADEPEKLVNAINTSIEKYPFAVSIQIRGMHHCGGAIINERYILTAAHCVEKNFRGFIKDMKVLTGTSTLNNGGIRYDVENMFHHEKYDTKNLVNGFDIGLIKLAKEIKFDNVRQPISLSNCDAPISEGARVSIIAWGRLFHGGPVSNALQILNTYYMSNTECQKHLRQPIPPISFCTFIAPSLGTCSGDSGSAVIHNGKIIGLVSAGRPCATGVPDIKTDVCSHKAWIQNAIIN